MSLSSYMSISCKFKTEIYRKKEMCIFNWIGFNFNSQINK